MKSALFYLSGVLTVVTLLRLRKVQWFHDDPPTPEGWQPKYRNWKKGVEVE